MKVVVTGATKGIGRAVVEKFAQAGADIAFCARTSSDVEAMLMHLQNLYPKQKFIAQAVDMANKEQVLNFGKGIMAQWNEINVLVNNAGIFIPCKLTDPANADNFVKMMDTNLYSAYYMTQSLLPSIQQSKKAHIFNLCSIASFMAYDSYSVSKFALLGYSKVLREELKKEKVRVTAVMPGAVRTASWDGTDLPDSRFMKVEDIADAIFACYNMSEYTVVEELILRPQLGDI